MDDLFAGQPADPAFSAFDNLTLSENPGASNAAVPELPDFAPNGTHGDLGPGPAQQAAEKVAWTRTRWSQQPPLARLSAAGLAGKRCGFPGLCTVPSHPDLCPVAIIISKFR